MSSPTIWDESNGVYLGFDNKVHTKPDGIPGNDDYGTMSVWYVFTSMGFYPPAGSSTYVIGSPGFDSITIRRNNGQCTLKILAHNNSAENVYVERVLLNGNILSTCPFIDHINQLQCLTDHQQFSLTFSWHPHQYQLRIKLVHENMSFK